LLLLLLLLLFYCMVCASVEKRRKVAADSKGIPEVARVFFICPQKVSI